MRTVVAIVLAALLVAGCAGEGVTADPALDRQLIEVAREGDLDAVRSLLERGADVEAVDGSGATALVAAASGTTSTLRASSSSAVRT